MSDSAEQTIVFDKDENVTSTKFQYASNADETKVERAKHLVYTTNSAAERCWPVRVHKMSCEQISGRLNEITKDKGWKRGWYRRFGRAYCTWDAHFETWVVVCCEHADLVLLGHEMGHVMGRKHSRWPGVMNATGLLRPNALVAVWKYLQHWWRVRKAKV